MSRLPNLIALTAFAVAAVVANPASAQKKYDPGASDTEVKIGNIMPYSGPASSYGVIGKTEEAFFRMINAEGGVNGRKINFISYDDAYSPTTRARAASTPNTLSSISPTARSRCSGRTTTPARINTRDCATGSATR